MARNLPVSAIAEATFYSDSANDLPLLRAVGRPSRSIRTRACARRRPAGGGSSLVLARAPVLTRIEHPTMQLPPRTELPPASPVSRPRARRQLSATGAIWSREARFRTRRGALLRRVRGLELREAVAVDPARASTFTATTTRSGRRLFAKVLGKSILNLFRGRGSASNVAARFSVWRDYGRVLSRPHGALQGARLQSASTSKNDATIDAIFARIPGKRHVLVKADIEGRRVPGHSRSAPLRRRHRRHHHRVSRHRSAAPGVSASGRASCWSTSPSRICTATTTAAGAPTDCPMRWS